MKHQTDKTAEQFAIENSLNQFISKKRVACKEKFEWIRKIIDVSLKLIEEKGDFVEIRNLNTRPTGVNHKSLKIMFSTPFNRLTPENIYMLDIWEENTGKVLLVTWEPLSIISFKRGEWLYDLFQP